MAAFKEFPDCSVFFLGSLICYCWHVTVLQLGNLHYTPDICHFFHTNIFCGLEIVHLKVRKITTNGAKSSVHLFCFLHSVENFTLTTFSDVSGKYQVWLHAVKRNCHNFTFHLTFFSLSFSPFHIAIGQTRCGKMHERPLPDHNFPASSRPLYGRRW